MSVVRNATKFARWVLTVQLFNIIIYSADRPSQWGVFLCANRTLLACPFFHK